MLKKLNTLPLEMAEDEDYNLHLVRGDDGITEMGLYQVVLTLQQMRGERKGKPKVSTYMVLAESEEGAISQVEDIAVGGKFLAGLEARDAGLLTGVAYRQPMYIRGWGSRIV